MSNLPSGWAKATLGHLAVYRNGRAFKASEWRATGIPIIRIQNLNDKSAAFNYSDAAHDERHWARDGDVLVAWAASLGAYTWDGPGAWINQHIFRVDPIPQISHKRYLYYTLKAAINDLYKKVQGSGIVHVTKGVFEGHEVALAPLPEQARVAAKLDIFTERIASCRARLDRVPPILKQFREAVLEAAVSGRLTEEWRKSASISNSGAKMARDLNARFTFNLRGRQTKNAAQATGQIREIPVAWGWTTGEKVVATGAEIVYGIVQPGPKLSDGVRYVRGMDIEDGRILVDQLMRTSKTIAKQYERASLEGGDVLLGIIRATKVAIVPVELAGANITQGTARYRPSGAIRSKYLAQVLEAPLTQKWLHDHYRGIDMPGLNLADVRQVPIPLPSLEEQDEIIRRTDELLKLSESLSDHLGLVAAQVEKLTPAVLAKAFRGELVSQDPNDEPVSVLIERMRREAASALQKLGVRKAKAKSMKPGRRRRAA